MPVLYQPDTLFAEGRFHDGAGLLVGDDGTIDRVLSDPKRQAPAGARLVALPGKALLPGFHNVHSHAFQRLIRGRTESVHTGGRSFWSWRGAMYHAAAHLSPEEMYAVARACFLEMALAGTTTVGEFHYVHRTPHGAAYDDPNTMACQVIAAAQSVGIRICLLRSAYQRAGFEKAPDPGQRRFLESTSEFLSAVEELHSRFHTAQAWVGVAPHSVRALPIAAVEPIAHWAHERGLPCHMHVSEQVAEVEECIREYGVPPVRLLADAGLLDRRFTAIHATHLSSPEMDLLAEAGATVCACPTTERNLGDGILSARELMERGIPIAFGSDSQAQIEPLEDAREIEYHLRLREQRRSLLDGIDGQPLAARLFDSATLNGARALHANAGTLERGRHADFFTVALDDISLAGSHGDDLLPAIVFGMRAAAVADVCVGGEMIVRDRRHPQREEIVTEYQEIARRVWTEPQPAMREL